MSAIRPKHILIGLISAFVALIIILSEVSMWRNNFSDAIKIHIFIVIVIILVVLIDYAHDDKWPWEKKEIKMKALGKR